MQSVKYTSDYGPKEELLNILTHIIGIIFAIVALVFMIIKALETDINLNGAQIASVCIFGSTLILMFLGSTLYHSFSNTPAKFALKRLDHSAIFALIAGTYSPILLIGIGTTQAWVLFWILWTIALFGIIMKLFFVDKFKKLSLILYLGMGWLSVLIIKDLYFTNKNALLWIAIGGLLYTIGTIFYVAKRYKYTHAIWHIFVLSAAICQTCAIWFYIIAPMRNNL
ncbi:MAG: hemolysin III family protein [Sulfurovaceae bacterium]|nr:hemolysin III family protein [Sulfurovaceae bacterium]MDD5549576.1 hemolysin III family protein [Sulfurovaceae bacterium]